MSAKHVICFNGGSSSIKVAIKKVTGGEVESIVDFNCQGLGTGKGYIDIKRNGEKEVLEKPMADHATALHEITALIDKLYPGMKLDAAGHRVLHGGPVFKETTLIDGIDGKVQETIKKFFPLGPLHNPANHQIIMACLKDEVLNKIPHAAIFDTQFHARMEDHVKFYAVPDEWRTKYSIQRYGFHGTSYAYITGRFAELNGLAPEDTNVVIAHLGNGCSMAKVEKGIGADTSMGLTPLEGLVMGTRSGDIDPGVLELIADSEGLDIKEIVRILNKESGLLGLYNKDGIKEMHFIRQAAMEGDKKAELVVDIAAYRTAKYFAEYLGTMKSPKGIVFTGGVGENEGYFRTKVLNFMALFDWKIDEKAMATRSEEKVVAESGLVPGLKAWVIPTDEEKVFALEAAKFIQE